jgi:small subunit ribosomal protein S4
MGRYIGPVCRLCRREGIKLFLKGPRCDSPKCAVTRREQPPGMHVQRRRKFSDFGKQLREKQKAKRFYGVFERQFRRYFAMAERQKGNTGENLVVILERRLDNVCYRGRFAVSRSQARQLIAHGHIFINGRKVDVPGYLVAPGDVIAPGPREVSLKLVREFQEVSKAREAPTWMQVEESPPSIKIASLPNRAESSAPIEEQLVVEFCSK